MAFGWRQRRKDVQQPTLPGIDVPRIRQQKERPKKQRARFPYVPLVDSSVSRRSFLTRSLGWTSVAIGGCLGALGVGAITAPAFRKESGEWSPIGRLGDPEEGQPDLLTEGAPMLTTFVSMVQDAYLQARPQNIPVFVLNEGGEFTILDVRCTHLGCPVTWEEKDGEFLSPCHGGVFDMQGKVVGGPPPRPLDRYEAKVEDGVLFAGALYQVDDELKRITP